MSKEFIEQQIETDLKFLDKNREVITNETNFKSSTRVRQVLKNIPPVYVRTRPKQYGGVTYAMHLAKILRGEIAREEADNERHRQKEARKESDLKYPLINNRYGNYSFFLARQTSVFSDSFP